MKNRPQARVVHLLLTTVFLGLAAFHLSRKSEPQEKPPSAEQRLDPDTVKVHYREAVKPILESRCIVCHGCYDAPCQLNLSAHEGIVRGANKARVYNPSRLLAVEPTRLFLDARGLSEWRKLDFFPVLNEGSRGKETERNAGLIQKMLQLKRQHPLPRETPLPPGFDFSLDREQYCPKADEFEDFAKEKPLWGMPYGLPALTDREYRTLSRWLEKGALHEPPGPVSPGIRSAVIKWEGFLNGNTPKEQLMSRYLYEHLFLAHFYFGAHNTKAFFRLVRSKTPPGEAIDLVVTRRPYDDPEIDRVYYRLQAVHSTILAKTHMPYRLDSQRMARYRELFLVPAYTVSRLPSYEAERSANPFATFQSIPAKSRYMFLLDEAAFSIGNFIKGPVCRGQVALSVINERFWIFFVNPENPALAHGDEFLAKELENLRMPTEKQSNATVVSNWFKYYKLEKKYFAAKINYIKAHLPQAEDISLDIIWEGYGKNDNAALTVFRQLDNGSIVKGLIGDEPKTAILLDYPLLERIHYLLVAGYDIFGNIGHQLNSRLYMDFMRMEGEFNFLILLPEKERVKTWKHWYRKALGTVEDHIYGYNKALNRQTGIQYKTNDPKSELLGLLKTRLAPVLNRDYELKRGENEEIGQALKRLSQIKGAAASLLPQSAVLSIAGEQDLFFTLIQNRGLANVSHLFFEDMRRLPEEDNLTVVRGFAAAYPNAFYHIPPSELDAFVDAVAGLRSESDYQDLLDRFGIRRNDPDFWKHSDILHAAYQKTAPVEAGLLDYNRLENR